METKLRQEPWPYKRHSDYEVELRNAATAWFSKQGYAVTSRMAYCLADRGDWTKNVVDTKAVQYITNAVAARRADKTPFPLHKYVHHGLSSQALLFNLVGPLAARGDYAPLRSAVEAVGVRWPESGEDVAFEYEDRSIFNEQQVQPTSIDLVIGDPSKSGALYIECKLVEPGFGGCSLFVAGDCEGSNPVDEFGDCYLHHIGRTYLTALREAGAYVGQLAADSLCPLANHYQFYRELLMAVRKDGYFLLLGDERSPVFVKDGANRRRGTWHFLTSRLPDHLRSRVAFVSIQNVVRKIEASGRHPWIDSFKQKYGL